MTCRYNATFQQPTDRLDYFIDVLLTVGVVWSLIPLFWISSGYSLANVVGNPETAVIVGYCVITAFWIAQDQFRDWSARCDAENRYYLRTPVWASHDILITF